MKPCNACSCSGRYVDHGGFDCGGILVPCKACGGSGWLPDGACPTCGHVEHAPSCDHVYILDCRTTLATWRCWKCGDVKHGFLQSQTIRSYGTVQVLPSTITGVSWRVG